ncbi:hypothetical protein D3Z62_30330, partial [Lachnospiraceae bacterium]|nr:hypothetical protein [Lachnospiraceae bacterium]
PLYTERYVQWCGRSAAQLMGSLLPDNMGFSLSPATITKERKSDFMANKASDISDRKQGVKEGLKPYS